jgi:O-antigen/teichoic acid export membrane protein
MSTKKKSIKKNFLYNIVLKMLNILFPIITFPYVARVLSTEGIGKVDFSLSIIQLFIVIAQFGIPIYGVRECAKVRDDRDKLAKTVQEILLINFLTTIISYILLALTIINVDKFIDYQNILIIMSISIIATTLGLEWLFQAIEEYGYIAIRSLFVKLISLILMFTLVKSQNDYTIYGGIIVISTTLGYIFNFIYANKSINLLKIYTKYDFRRHIKPISLLFAMSLSTSIYVNLDKVMIGLISGDRFVGLYVAANKIVIVILAILTSLGTVLLPRMSYYIENEYISEINRLIRKSIDFILMIAIPATIGIIMLAKPIILLFAGQDFVEAISTIKIISPILVAISLSNLIGVQILISHGKEKITLFSTSIGALINFILNLILIPIFHHNGAAIGTLIAESVVLIIQIIFSRSYIKGNINFKNIFIYIIGSFLIFLTCLIIRFLFSGLIIITILSVILSISIYFSFLYIMKNELIIEIVNKTFRKLKRAY